jgi:putative DNA primase/helicase
MSEKPKAAVPQFENFPPELTSLNQWVLWNYELSKKKTKWTKVPKKPNGYGARSTHRDTWSVFDRVREVYALGKFDGVGFVVSQDDPYVLVDVDHAFDPTTGEIADWARPILSAAKSELAYVEYSVSMTGFHVIGTGDQTPFGGKGKKTNNCERYVKERYFTMSGHIL